MTLSDILIDFGIPVILIGVSTFLLISGIDGEVKGILIMAAAWAFHGAVRRPKST